jgi:integrase
LVDLVMEDVKEQAYSTYLGKLSAVNQFRKFAGDDLILPAVTPGYIQRFQDHLRKIPARYSTRLKGATINKYFDRLHKIHQEVLVKTGMTRRQAERQSPWSLVDPLIEQKVRKGKFNEVTIDAIKTKTVDTRRRRVTPDSAFRIWLLSHALAGMRISDLLFVRYQNFTLDEAGEPVGLRYEMLKTGQLMNIPVLEEARGLLKTYWSPDAAPADFVLPFLNKKMKYAQVLSYEQYRQADFETKRQLYNAFSYWDDQINACLALIEREAELKTPLRMHTARHSFAELARTIMQQDKTLTVYDIQLMLGHSSFKTTKGYYNDSADQDTSESMKAVFGRGKK